MAPSSSTADYFWLPVIGPGSMPSAEIAFRCRSLGLVCIGNLRSDGRSGVWGPRSVRERCFVCESRNPYSLGMRTRSASAVVANPGSITMSWIVFPDLAMIICRCTGDWLPLVTVKVPVQSGSTEYVPVFEAHPGATLPLTAIASSWVRFPLPSNVVLARPSMISMEPFGRKNCPWMVKAYLPRIVELLQALAWAVKVDDASRARARRKSEKRNFMVPPDFLGSPLALFPSFDVYLAA